jgi:predicted Rossmann fold flavoprotein
MTGQVVVIGGGAAGMMAAGRAAQCGAHVLLLEKTPRLGNKLRLTGKGRCNLTNYSELNDFVAHFQQGRFLYRAFSRYFVQDLIEFFEQRGVATVVERGQRVFPVSNNALQVVDALEGFLKVNGVQVRRNNAVTGLLNDGGRITGVEVRSGRIPAAAVILATGGASYPKTGSTGDGYRLASALGHKIVPIRPALVPLVTQEGWVPQLQGLTLYNAEVTLLLDNTPIGSDRGEMLFTHFGVSGPMILTLSKRAVDALDKGNVSLQINLRPTLTSAELEKRLQAELESRGRTQIENILGVFMPGKLTSVFVKLAGIPAAKLGNQVTAAERKRIMSLLQDLRVTVTGSRPIEEAIVTAGGVDTVQVEPRTMESRLVKGLFFCGEVLDFDADTGGYNLQAAFSTGYLAGESAAQAAADCVDSGDNHG